MFCWVILYYGTTALWRHFLGKVLIPGVVKIGSANLNFLCNFSQLPLSNISLFTVLFTAYVGFFRVFELAFWLGICFQVDVEIITAPPPHARLTRPVPSLCFLSLPTILSLIQVALSHLKSVRPLSWFRFRLAVYFYILCSDNYWAEMSRNLFLCISNNLPEDLNASIHVTSVFFFPSGKRGGGNP